jgi:voltage-gated potassium channel
VTVSVSIVAGVLIHVTDPKNFSNVGEGLWWAIQTVTTVGYGDLVQRARADGSSPRS